MSDVNTIQIGGDHYKNSGDMNKPQHWDLSIMYEWDPFQYQITKYVMRWKDKHPTHEKRVEDLRKAAHFLQKYIENALVYDKLRDGFHPLEGKIVDVPQPETVNRNLKGLAPVNSSAQMEEVHANDDWESEGFFGSGYNLYRCRYCRMLAKERGLADAIKMHPECPKKPGWQGLPVPLPRTV